MAKFCTNCGKKLDKDGKCNCKVEEKKIVTEEVTESKFSKILNDCILIIKGMFIRPVDTMTYYAKRSKFDLGMLLIVINCLLFGLFIYVLMKRGAVALYDLF